MNLREVIRSGYKPFSRMGAEKQKAHILAVQYIELLANQTGTKMEPWDLLQVFGAGKGNELITDKTEINKRFFAKVEEIKTKTPAQVFALEQRISDQIDALTRTQTDREILNLRKNRDSYISNAIRSFERANADLTEAHRVEVNIMALERRESTASGQIAQILQENFWDFHQLTGENLELTTRNDILLTQRNAAASIDLRVNFGKVRAIINLRAMTVSVLKYEGNIELEGGYYHPHINPSGNICWGTAATTVAQKLPKGEIADVLRLLASVLTNYNDGNPYRSLAEFQKKAERDAPPKDAPPPLPPEMEAGRARAAAAATEVRPAPPVMGYARHPGISILEGLTSPVEVSIGSFSENEALLQALRGISLDRVTPPPGHPTDSTQPAMDGCECDICRVSRESARRQEEFSRLRGALNPIFVGPNLNPPLTPSANVEAFMSAAPERREDNRD